MGIANVNGPNISVGSSVSDGGTSSILKPSTCTARFTYLDHAQLVVVVQHIGQLQNLLLVRGTLRVEVDNHLVLLVRVNVGRRAGELERRLDLSAAGGMGKRKKRSDNVVRNTTFFNILS